jgi:RHH-type rel operon transcriptional repressor/antitoxin RelB
MSVTTIRLNKQEEALFQSYAELTGQPLSTLMKQALTEKIEDFLDLQAGTEALKKLSGESISLQEMMKTEDL